MDAFQLEILRWLEGIRKTDSSAYQCSKAFHVLPSVGKYRNSFGVIHKPLSPYWLSALTPLLLVEQMSVLGALSLLPYVSKTPSLPDFFFQNPLGVIEAEYHRLITIRLHFRVEEIVTDLLLGEYSNLNGPYQPKRRNLLVMRLLIGIACRAITCFEERCRAHRVDLTFADANRQSVLNSHAFKLLEPFLGKPGGLEELTDFREYYDISPEDYHLVEECDEGDIFPDPWYEAHRDWLETFPFPDEPLDDSST